MERADTMSMMDFAAWDAYDDMQQMDMVFATAYDTKSDFDPNDLPF